MRNPLLLADRRVLLCGLVGIAIWGCSPAPSSGPMPPSSPSASDRLPEARAAMKGGKLEDAFAIADAMAAGTGPQRNAALLIAGEVRQRQKRFDEAVDLFLRIDEVADEFVIARQTAGDLRLHQGRLSDAESIWRSTLSRAPTDEFTLNRLALVLGLQGRRWEARLFLETVVRQGTCTAQNLLLLGDLDRTLNVETEAEQYRAAAPEDVAALIGLAKVRREQGRFDDAVALLEKVVATREDLDEAWVELGLLASDRGEAAFDAWVRRIAARPTLREHPTFWLALGRHEQAAGRRETAARCFYQAARLNPNSIPAHYQLGQLLTALKRTADSEPFLLRAARLEQLAGVLNRLHSDPTAELMLETADHLDALGRPWEARLWIRFVWQAEPARQPQIRERLARRESALADDTVPFVLPETCPAFQVDLSALPLPKLAPAAPGSSVPESTSSGAFAFRFEDDAPAAGIEMTYFNSADPATEGMRMFEFTGGGVGAADFDRDGWPDLYLTQGCVLPPRPQTSADLSRLDQLYRNRGNGTFANATAGSTIIEPRFGQGLAWGDVNHDGFPDLYVGNLGPNALFLNNGDGTFSEVTADLSDGGGDAWTTSVGMADLDGDGAVDLYAANYLAGDEIYTKMCVTDGRPRACLPIVFPAAPDAFHQGTGDGRFVERTKAAGFDVPLGNGLGLLVADFDGSRTLDVFVANDAVPNFFFSRDSADPGAPFTDVAFANGTAVDAEGRPQACMGVAADDLDGDGDLDLFVTNFYLESNTFYENHGEGLFRDATRDAGLKEPGYKLLGFGTQAIDGDNDGRPELVIANGHIDDFSFKDIPFRMPPLFLSRSAQGRFVEAAPKAMGPYFEKEWLGRGLAMLDWNRDGREDFVVTHLEDPAALLTNRTATGGRWLSVELVGRESPRHPVGAQVTVSSGETRRTRFLTAGCGYQASNSPLLHFGLGSAGEVATVEVRWPSGRMQRFEVVPLDREVVCVEGEPNIVPKVVIR
ncbi:FG-GAP-like repeat-containing protein [Planctomyces sp. SH-PL14]|uniref:FG-GAP-like repeat-containing protein n=1 Tax=Planctomyces sp. SH-PL14 TaxID=1632864 RepID=UPI0012E7A2F0|nr:FG-GAP-like repeat-containing protein [Planctomyces sp. SH-PL14]